MVLVERDAQTGATYIVIDDAAEVARTLSPSDLVNVDVDANGHPIGIEFAMRQENFGEDTWHDLVNACADLKGMFPDVTALRGLVGLSSTAR